MAASIQPAHSADVDQIVVDRMLSGDTPAGWTYAERATAIARLDALRMSAREISVRLRIAERTVVRYRAATRTATEAPPGARYGHWMRAASGRVCMRCGVHVPAGARVRGYSIAGAYRPDGSVCEACGTGNQEGQAA